MKLAAIFAATLFMSSAAEAACKTWDLNCDPNTGGIIDQTRKTNSNATPFELVKDLGI